MKFQSFSEVFLSYLILDHQTRGMRAYAPWVLILCIGIPVGFANFAFQKLHGSPSATALPPVYAALLVVGGFLGAVSINIMGQTVGTVSEARFARYLKDIKAFDYFLFWPQMTLGIQLGLIATSLLSLISYFLAPSSRVTVYSTAVAFGLLAYSCIKTWSLIELLRQLAWHRQDYTAKLEDEIERQTTQRNQAGVTSLRP
jgi:small-conductance mechanosensitive channel